MPSKKQGAATLTSLDTFGAVGSMFEAAGLLISFWAKDNRPTVTSEEKPGHLHLDDWGPAGVGMIHLQKGGTTRIASVSADRDEHAPPAEPAGDQVCEPMPIFTEHQVGRTSAEGVASRYLTLS